MLDTKPAQRMPNPFNPGSPVDPTEFIGRTMELNNFRERLKQTENGSLASMAIAGGYGVGKTSFLHKCKNIAEERGDLVVYFSLNELTKIDKDELARTLISRIKDKVNEEVILKRLEHRVFEIIKRIKIGNEMLSVEIKDSDNEYPNLQAALNGAWKALSGQKKAIVFLIDEAGILEKNKAELMLYLRAVLEQLQVERSPVMIVPAGKFSITGPTGTGFSPLVRTFPPAVLENFTKEESTIFVRKKLEQIRVNITNKACDMAYSTTEGHPFVLTAYLKAAYSKLKDGEHEINDLHLKAVDIEFAAIVLSPFFSRFYDRSGTSREILTKTAENNGKILLSELTQKLGKDNNQLSPFLAKLVQEGAVVRIDRGEYKLFHHLFADYIKRNKNP